MPENGARNGRFILLAAVLSLSESSNPIYCFVFTANVKVAEWCVTCLWGILAEPSKETPPIVLAVVNVAALPVVFWLSVGKVQSSI